MIFWSNQHIDAWKMAKQIGYLEGNATFVWKEFWPYYQWMMGQMKKRLPRYQGEVPIWIWTKKPDLRCSGHFMRGTRAVCLELELEESDVLLSDFDAWHHPLNDGSLLLTDEEEDQEQNGTFPLSKEETWERIFEHDLLLKSYHEGKKEAVTLQGTTGRIPLECVKGIREFIAK